MSSKNWHIWHFVSPLTDNLHGINARVVSEIHDFLLLELFKKMAEKNGKHTKKISKFKICFQQKQQLLIS